jgi:sulfite exporter TauE/SafE
LALASFGLGTVPTLIVVGIAGHGAGRLWNGAIARAAPALLLLNATLLGALAVSGLIG